MDGWMTNCIGADEQFAASRVYTSLISVEIKYRMLVEKQRRNLVKLFR